MWESLMFNGDRSHDVLLMLVYMNASGLAFGAVVMAICGLIIGWRATIQKYCRIGDWLDRH